ncbi:hypothetical protein [Streptomyces sp. NPDC014622]|uniref:hypothetical protein n=1 Tax=Streptomyces sp. NPDC014622 TaxID=3364874 RepID=UPI0036FD9444
MLGADIAAGHFIVQNTLIAYAELLRRHGCVEELRVLGTGEHAGETLAYYARALEDDGQAGEAEAVLRRFIAAAEYPDRFRWPLIELLSRPRKPSRWAARRSITTMPAFSRASFTCCMWLAGWTMLWRSSTSAMLSSSRSTHRSNRICLPGEADRHEEALAYAGTLPPAMYGLTASKAWILEEMGRVEEAIALLRADTEVRPS